MTMKLLPSILEASLPASPFASRFFFSRSPRIDSNRALLSDVARSALPRGSRKLRAKPSFTRTVSPIWPSLPTRSSRMTSIVVTPFELLSIVSSLARRRALGRHARADAEGGFRHAEQKQEQQRPTENHHRG